MASYTPTIPSSPPFTSRGKGGNPPPTAGGEDDFRHDPSSPDFRTRLRRARLGLAVALTPVIMLFVSFTSAYIVRQGLPTLDPNTNSMVRDWLPVPLPTLLFLINTCVLLFGSATIELARRQLARKQRLRPRAAFPGYLSGPNENFPGWL